MVKIDEKELLVMKLIHYFMIQKDYIPVIIRGIDNEVWLENPKGEFRIIRIVTKNIFNNEQFEFDSYKSNVILDTIINLTNDKHRRLSLFGKELDKKQEYFGDVYYTTYNASFAEIAQAHRHRTLDYQMELMDEPGFYIPPIIEGDKSLVEEWINDIYSVKDVHPQGELVLVSESGKYEDFILKCKERLCSCAQLEINNQTRWTLWKMKAYLEETNHPLKDDIEKYTHGARCTFPDFDCSSDCKFKEGKTLSRRI